MPTETQDVTHLLEQFGQALRREEAAELTIKNYGLDLAHFARWFQIANGEALTLKAITPTDVREYKTYQLTVEQAKPATVNRRRAALRKFCRWAKAQQLIDDDPTEGSKGVDKVRLAPKSLSK